MWPKIGGPVISNDGHYVAYYQPRNGVTGSNLVVQSTQNNWAKELIIGGAALFSSDSKQMFYKSQGDSVGVITLGTSESNYFSGVNSFELVNDGKDEWLACLFSQPLGKFILQNLRTGLSKSFEGILSILISPSKRNILLETIGKVNGDMGTLSKWLSLPKDSLYVIGNGFMGADYLFNEIETGLVFLETKQGSPDKLCWLYKPGMHAPEFLFRESELLPSQNVKVDYLSDLDLDSNRFAIHLHKKSIKATATTMPSVNVWSYTDKELQPNYLLHVNDSIENIEGVFSVKDHSFMKLTSGIDQVETKNNRFWLVSRYGGQSYERYWNKSATDSVFLISLTDGHQIFFKARTAQLGKNHLIYFNEEDDDFYSYNLRSGKKCNLTTKINTDWTQITADLSLSHYSPNKEILMPAGWIEDAETVLLYDRYDIWQIDLNNKKLPLCLTNGFGKKHHVIFRLLDNRLLNSSSLVITAFDDNTKENGFYQIQTGISANPAKLMMGAYTYYAPQKKEVSSESRGMMPVKAKESDGYILMRQSAIEFPNLYFTEDFSTVRQLTNNAPQKKYNWMSSELISWTTPDGIKTQGILYKPEDFDSTKKYPLIFDIYELRSDDLNTFLLPQVSGDRIDIPWYVSRGYLVFTPDIFYLKGKPFESTLNTIVSGVKKLCKFAFVDSKKLGLQGHSWGGMQANYVVTHTNLFAAICSASGVADYISLRGTLCSNTIVHTINTLDAELYQSRAPGTLWEYPEWYTNNSPVIQANRVTTPFLMMHTTNDQICPFSQAVEFFTALRRLGKKAWLLEYEGERHSLFRNAGSAKDYTIRMGQFFDYYLKNAPAPKWMVEGVPGVQRRYYSGLELEPYGIGPGPGLLKTIEIKSKK